MAGDVENVILVAEEEIHDVCSKRGMWVAGSLGVIAEPEEETPRHARARARGAARPPQDTHANNDRLLPNTRARSESVISSYAAYRVTRRRYGTIPAVTLSVGSRSRRGFHARCGRYVQRYEPHRLHCREQYTLENHVENGYLSGYTSALISEKCVLVSLRSDRNFRSRVLGR